jgi:UPF0755 protein
MGPGIEDLGIDVRGVTDRPSLDGPDDGGLGGEPTDPTLYPVSPQRLAEQKAAAARLGLAPSDTDLRPLESDRAPLGRAMALQSAGAANPNGPRRILDASEGTALDPLLNKSWDLNSPKTVPTFR